MSERQATRQSPWTSWTSYSVIQTCEGKARASGFMIESQSLRNYKALVANQMTTAFHYWFIRSVDQLIARTQICEIEWEFNKFCLPKSTVNNYNHLKFRSYTKLNQTWKTSLITNTTEQSRNRYMYHSSRPCCQHIRVKVLKEVKWKRVKVDNPVANIETGHLLTF